MSSFWFLETLIPEMMVLLLHDFNCYFYVK